MDNKPNRKKYLAPDIEDKEVVARYSFTKRDIKISSHTISPKLFLKKNEYNNVSIKDISVMRYTSCPEDCISKLGDIAGKNRDQSLKGAVSLIAKDINLISGLIIKSDDKNGNHRRHALINYPCKEYEKSEHYAIAQELADECKILFTKEQGINKYHH